MIAEFGFRAARGSFSKQNISKTEYALRDISCRVAERGGRDADFGGEKQIKQHVPMDVSWNRCFDLGMVCGVHIENDELPGRMEACAAGNIPFDNAESRLVMRPAQ